MITSNHWLLTIERRISNIHKLMIFPKYAKRDPSFGIVKMIIISLIFTGFSKMPAVQLVLKYRPITVTYSSVTISSLAAASISLARICRNMFTI